MEARGRLLVQRFNADYAGVRCSAERRRQDERPAQEPIRRFHRRKQGLKPATIYTNSRGPEGVQFHDILYKTFRDILYTPGRRHRSPSGRKKPAREGEGWLGERKTWKSSA